MKPGISLISLSVMLLGFSSLAQNNQQTQTIRLDPGWNLIAFQVIPSNPGPAAVFGTIGSAFERAWTYDSASKTWSSYARPGLEQSQHNEVLPLEAVEMGRAYWVYMNSQVNWSVTGSLPAIASAVTLTNGWNLVGIPIGQSALPETVNMLSVLTAAGLDYDTILRWELGLYRKFTPADTDVDDFTLFDANKGHWVHVKSSGVFNLQPRLLSSVRADVDVQPQGNYPSFEDLQLSTSRTPLGPTNQTHIVFLPGEDSQQVAIANTGGGVLAWEFLWTPEDATNVHWLQLSAASGITTIENDIVQVFLDRTSLPKGLYRGTLLLRTTAGNRSFQVVAHVPDLRGEWRGTAQISNVNGKKNEVADIDLHLDFFEDPSLPGLIRGLLDSRNSLLWPVDVPLIGHSGSLAENRFTLGGAFILPPGDQNNPPYATFATGGDAQDVDWNCNGLLDDANPFPFPIYRSVFLQGVLASSSLTNGVVITGDYTESVYGMLRTPIRLEGTFTLRRESPVPFTNRRPVANLENTNGTQPVVLRTFSPASPLVVFGGRTTNVLAFLTDLVLQRASVDLDFGDAPANGVKFILESPTGQQVVLHDRANLGTLRGMSFPALRNPVQSFDLFVNTGVLTKGNWKLIIDNSSGIGGKLYGWSLQLQGQPVFNVAGKILNSFGGTGLPAQVSLDGLPITSAVMANPDGSFIFNRLPGIPANFAATFPGYEPVNPALPGLAASYVTPSYGTNCDNPTRQALIAQFRPLPAMPVPPLGTDGFGNYGASTNPVALVLQPRSDLSPQMQLQADPNRGFGPLTVRFTMLPGTNSIPAGTFVTWVFGDGTFTNGIDIYSVEHTYSTVATNGYTAQLLTGFGSPTTQVFVMPSPGFTPYSNNFFQAHFTSGGTIPVNLIFSITGSNNPALPPAFAGLIMLQHADCASFDIDRAPFTTPANRDFHQDGFTNGMPSINPADYANGFKGEDNNYQVTTDQWSLAADCAYVFDDDLFNPHPKPGFTGDCNLTRYRMVCNIGPQVLAPPNAEVLAVPMSGPSPTFLPASPDPLLAVEKDQIAKARGLRLITGPLAADWNN